MLARAKESLLRLPLYKSASSRLFRARATLAFKVAEMGDSRRAEHALSLVLALFMIADGWVVAK